MKQSFLSLLLLITLFSQPVNALANGVTITTQNQLISLINAPSKADFIILDVRSEKEFAAGHIPGAINIAHNDVENKLAQLTQYKDSQVIVHCRSGRRAQTAESVLIANGFSKVHHLAGDFNQWQAEKLSVTQK